MQDSFSSLEMNKCLERVDDRHFWNPGVFSYAMIPRCRPNSRVFSFIVASIIVYEYKHVLAQLNSPNKKWASGTSMLTCLCF